MKDFYPICTGPCSFYTLQGISQSLHTQGKQYQALLWAIHRDRMSRLTPEIMKRELSDLGARIHNAMKH